MSEGHRQNRRTSRRTSRLSLVNQRVIAVAPLAAESSGEWGRVVVACPCRASLLPAATQLTINDSPVSIIS